MADVHDKTVYILSEQPTTCPQCGTRTDFGCFIHTNAQFQIHVCLNGKCGYEFVALEE